MPSSRPNAIEKICNIFINTKPVSVLDIGCGFGKFGFLAREYIDAWGGGNRYWEWKTKIDAIEIYSKYITKLHHMIYDNIYIGDVMGILPSLKYYNMVVCSDMIEHLRKEAGCQLIQLIRDKSTIAAITTPIGERPQDEVYGNKHERHLCSWTREELEVFGKVVEVGDLYLLLINGVTPDGKRIGERAGT